MRPLPLFFFPMNLIGGIIEVFDTWVPAQGQRSTPDISTTRKCVIEEGMRCMNFVCLICSCPRMRDLSHSCTSTVSSDEMIELVALTSSSGSNSALSSKSRSTLDAPTVSWLPTVSAPTCPRLMRIRCAGQYASGHAHSYGRRRWSR